MVWPNSFWIEFLHNTYFRSNAIIVQSSLLGTLHSKVQQMQNCSKHFMKRTVWNSANASCDFSWNMVISLKLLSLNATLSFGKMKESHGVILREKGECVTSHCLQTQIHTHTHTQTKYSDWVHSHGGETSPPKFQFSASFRHTFSHRCHKVSTK